MIDIPATIAAIGTVVTAIGVILVAYWAYRGKREAADAKATIVVVAGEVRELGRRVDGRLSDLLAMQAAKGASDVEAARAAGIAIGEQAQRDRAAPSDSGGTT